MLVCQYLLFIGLLLPDFKEETAAQMLFWQSSMFFLSSLKSENK